MFRLVSILALCLMVIFQGGPVWAAFTLQQLPDTSSTLLTLSSLANNTRSTNGSTYDARQAGAGKGYLEAYLECALTFSVTPTAGTGVAIWLLRSTDGTNFEDTATSRNPDAVCPVRANTANRVGVIVRLRPLRYQAAAFNDGTGQTISSGTISLLPLTTQGN